MLRKKLKKKWKVIIILSLLLMVLLVYSFFIATSGLIIKEYKVENSNLPNSFYGLKVVHFSDLYYSKSINEEELSNIVDKINLTNPDIVVFTGDLLDKDTVYTENIESIIVKYLSKIESTYGNYYVDGDNDKYNSSFANLMIESGFIDLNDYCEEIISKENESILLCGLDVEYSNLDFIDNIDYSYKILITHYPDYIEKINDYNFNLVLSGHSYNGQIKIPFMGGLIKRNHANDYYNDYYKINNADLYISGGLGTDNINIRFLNKPSFNLYRLVDK